MANTGQESGTAKAVRDNREKMLERSMSRHAYAGNALIEVLHTAQELYGFLEAALLKQIAVKLHLPPSRVLAVATFYNFFSLKPKGEHTAAVCLGTACYVGGALELVKKLEHRCAKVGATSPDGKVSVQVARCIGSCGLAPAVILDGQILPRVTPAQMDAVIDRLLAPTASDAKTEVTSEVKS